METRSLFRGKQFLRNNNNIGSYIPGVAIMHHCLDGGLMH